jgi:hypothetical protein
MDQNTFDTTYQLPENRVLIKDVFQEGEECGEAEMGMRMLLLIIFPKNLMNSNSTGL